MITMDNEAARLLMLQSLQAAGAGPACRLSEILFAFAAVKGKGGRRIRRDSSVNLGDHCRRLVSKAEFPPLFAPLSYLVCLN